MPWLLEPFIVFIAGLLGTLFLTPLVIKLAHRLNVFDQPGERKIHESPVPRIGGLSILAAFALGSLVALVMSVRIRLTFEENLAFWLSLGAGSLLVFLLGLWDDLRGVGVWVKFAVQFTAAALVMVFGDVVVWNIGNPLGGAFDLWWTGIPVTALWIVGVTNAFNLIDGMDGLAGGVALISTATVSAIALMVGQRSLVVLATALLAGSLLGFLRYNFHPARIFLGDCGAMFVGFILAVLSTVGAGKRTVALALMIPILIVGIPVFDTLNAMGRRLGRKVFVEKELHPSALKAMFKADREHLHHTLMDMGYTHKKTVVIVYGMSVIMALLALFAALFQDDRVSLGLIIVGVVAYVGVKQFGKYVAVLPPSNGKGRSV